MKWTIVGLGNPGEEYESTRHNAGRLAVETFEHATELGVFVYDKKLNADVARGKVGKHALTLVLPDTFMNKSGNAVKPLVTNTKAAEQLIVVHDDIDLPIGTLRVSFGRGSGGHKGLESIISALKTRDFVRVRVGVSPATPKGVVKKPQGEKKVQDFLLKPLTKSELSKFKPVLKSASDALTAIVERGRVAAMNEFN